MTIACIIYITDPTSKLGVQYRTDNIEEIRAILDKYQDEGSIIVLQLTAQGTENVNKLLEKMTNETSGTAVTTE